MTEAQALAILSLTQQVEDPQELSDHIVELVFPIREFFLRQPIISVLFQSRIHRLEKIAEAAKYFRLTFSTVSENYSLQAFQTNDPLEFLLSSYEEQLSDLRLLAASTFDPLLLSAIATKMIILQLKFEDQFLELTTHLSPLKEEVKAAEAMDTGRVLFRLKREGTSAVQSELARERQRILLLRSRTAT